MDRSHLLIYKRIVFGFFLYLLTVNAIITQTCITLLDVYIEKNLEDFIFCPITEYATLKSSFSKFYGRYNDLVAITNYH
jgi:hypothetical protein